MQHPTTKLTKQLVISHAHPYTYKQCFSHIHYVYIYLYQYYEKVKFVSL